MLKRYWLLLVITSFICCSTSTITVKASPLQSIRDVCVLKYQRITKHYVEDGLMFTMMFIIGLCYGHLLFVYWLYICSMTIIGWIATLGLSQEVLSLIGLLVVFQISEDRKYRVFRNTPLFSSAYPPLNLGHLAVSNMECSDQLRKTCNHHLK